MCAQLFLIGVITAPVIKNIVSPNWCPIIMPNYYSYAHLIPNIGHYKWALVIIGHTMPNYWAQKSNWAHIGHQCYAQLGSINSHSDIYSYLYMLNITTELFLFCLNIFSTLFDK